ncbi:PTS sugar transporter subunit IIC [Erysipelothrix inopinata]|uniref:Permease IIC component n=1 Tax=Erysipelothrix inopinata TaxID=225084 RepID=A0A7G9S0N7_9FIRM|nr:PTS sugar transporter subunit IIC [Erysipelothrix inopinata]QNN61412.1 PTS sugar transporter subunit IIC [Erysipelothrix inopinata]
MFDWLENTMAPIAEKLSTNKVLVAIRDGFLISTPLIIVASIFLLIANFPITGYPEFMEGIFGAGWDSHLLVVSNATINMIALLNVLGIAYSYAKQLKVEPIAGGVVALVSYLIITPQTHELFLNADGKPFRGFAFSNLNSQGLFLAMITAIIAVQIFAFVTKKGWVIKLPEGVPPAVMGSFAALVPSMFVMITFFLVRLVFVNTSFGSAQNFIFTVLQTPLMGLGTNNFFEVIYQFLSNLFWFFGINGPAITNTVFSPIHNTMTYANQAAYIAGETLPYIFTGPFSDFFGNYGGGGSTLSLVLLMVTMGKSQRMKQLGRLSIVPGIFGINEMIIFGLPIVLNPIILIPFLLVPVMNIALSTAATIMGIIPYTTGIALPWTTPIFFSGWLSTGSLFAGVFQLGLLALGCLVYYPFFRILDKQYLEDEMKPQDTVVDELDDISLDDISFDDL